jgi:hypothetical protein
MQWIRGFVPVWVVLAACGSSSSGGQPNAPDPPSTREPEPARTTLCEAQGVGNLTGVSLTLRSAKCIYHSGEPASFRAELVVNDNVPTIEVPLSTPCGVCVAHTVDATTFFSMTIGGTSTSGKPQRWCNCDSGCCAGEPASSIRPTAVSKTIELEWSGRTWNGASDTGEKEGAPFEPGHYRVHAAFNGFEQGKVEADLEIEIIP